MEELLNKLIEKGWKPFGNKKIKDAKTARRNINLLNEEVNKVSKFKDKVAFTNGVLIFDEINLRELVSKESGLWQFVCENDLINHDNSDHMDYWDKNYTRLNNKSDFCTDTYNYKYRLIESALCDEDKLEEFLLNNIVLDDKQ